MQKSKRNALILGVFAIILVLLIFLAPSYGWQLQQLFTPKDVLQTNDASLAAQNEALKAQVAELQSVEKQLPSETANYIPAIVYSRYPFDFKNEVLVNAGSDQGVMIGKAVTFQGIFIGTIEQVFPTTALVETVFDSNFKMAVRVGSSSYDGLLMGGAEPQVGSIAANALIETGDIIYTAAAGIPYDLPIAEVNTTSTSPDNLFQVVTLDFVYDINSVQVVSISK